MRGGDKRRLGRNAHRRQFDKPGPSYGAVQVTVLWLPGGRRRSRTTLTPIYLCLPPTPNAARNAPIAMAMAGGYGHDIQTTVRVQLNTYRIAQAAWARWQGLPAR